METLILGVGLEDNGASKGLIVCQGRHKFEKTCSDFRNPYSSYNTHIILSLKPQTNFIWPQTYPISL